MKKKNIAKALALLFTASAVISLASCNKNNNPNTPDTPEVQKYTITYNINGHGDETAAKGDLTTIPSELPTLTAEGYTFGGWYMDQACTNAVTKGATLTGNITLYAKWTKNADPKPEIPVVDETKIGTKEQFLSFLNRSSYKDENGKAITFTLTADIDMQGAEYAAPRTFDGILDGAGHTVKNITLTETDTLKNPTLFKVLSGCVVKDITFENVSASGTNANQAFLATFSFGNTYIQNVKFKNASITSGGVKNNSTSIDGKCGLLVAVAYDKLSVKNVAVDGLTINAKKYTGGLIGQLYKNGTVKPNGEDISVTAADVTLENIIMKNVSVTAGKDSDANGQSVGGVVGLMDDGSKLTVNGLVIDANVVGRKNVSLVVGDNKFNTSIISLKNVLVANGIAKTANGGSAAGVLFGQQKADVEEENVYYIDRVVDAYDESADKIKNMPLKNFDGEAIKASAVTTPTAAFTVADGKISLMGVEITLPTDVVTSDVGYGTLANGDDKATATYDATAHTLTYSGVIAYYSAEVAKTAGNYAFVKLTAPAGVDASSARIYIGNENVYSASSFAEGVYIPASFDTDGSKPEDVTIVVRWANNANDQTYTIKFADNVVKGEALANGTLSNEDSTLTTNVEGTKITYSAGTISAAEDNKNYITVKVTAPTGLASVEGATTSTANAVLDKGEGFVTIKLDVTSFAKPTGTNREEDSTLTFNVKWSATTDAQTYTVVINKEVNIVNDNVSTEVSRVTKKTFTANSETVPVDKSAPLNDGTKIGDFAISGKSAKRSNSDTYSVQLNKNATSYIEFTIEEGKVGDLTLEISSTGGSDTTTNAGLFKKDGTSFGLVTPTEGTTTLTGSTKVTVTFTNLSAGTYRIQTTDTLKGMRIYSINLE